MTRITFNMDLCHSCPNLARLTLPLYYRGPAQASANDLLMESTADALLGKKIIDTENVVIRFSGDSGDGMQLTGTLFSDTTAVFGNDICTFPDYPSEIRAPSGTLYGVSGFQIQFGSNEVCTPGDTYDVLVAM